METRRAAILTAVKNDLLGAVIENAESWLRSSQSSMVVGSILLNCDGKFL